MSAFENAICCLEGSQQNFSSPKKIRQLKAGRNNKCGPLHLQIELCSPLHCLIDCSWPFYIKLVSINESIPLIARVSCVFQAQKFCLLAIFWACFSSFFSLLAYSYLLSLEFYILD